MVEVLFHQPEGNIDTTLPNWPGTWQEQSLAAQPTNRNQQTDQTTNRFKLQQQQIGKWFTTAVVLLVELEGHSIFGRWRHLGQSHFNAGPMCSC